MEAVSTRRMPSFHRYRDQSGHSGVLAYALMPEAIAVKFVDGAVYLYSRDCPGPRHVDRMKALARAGSGLSTYISRHIGKRFTAKLH